LNDVDGGVATWEALQSSDTSKAECAQNGSNRASDQRANGVNGMAGLPELSVQLLAGTLIERGVGPNFRNSRLLPEWTGNPYTGDVVEKS
jgi:hypothetical protein